MALEVQENSVQANKGAMFDASGVLDAVQDAVNYFDRDGVLRFMNRRAAELLSGSREDFLGQHIEKLVPIVPFFMEEAWAGFVSFANNRKPVHWQHEDVRLLETVTQLIGSWLEKRRAHERLEAKEKILSSFIAESLDGIALMDSDGTGCTDNEALSIQQSEQRELLLEGKVPSEMASRSAPLAVSGTAGTALIGDDNSVNSQLFATVLERAGWKVLLAEEGTEALRMAEAVQPDILFIDIQMPGMDGFEVARRLRNHEDESLRTLPIVALTGYGENEYGEALRQSPLDGYLLKPVPIADLLSTANYFAGRQDHISKPADADPEFPGV